MIIIFTLMTVLLCFEFTEQRTINKINEHFSKSGMQSQESGHTLHLISAVNDFTNSATRSVEIFILFRNAFEKFKNMVRHPYIKRQKRSKRTSEEHLTNVDIDTNNTASNKTNSTANTKYTKHDVDITPHPSKDTSHIAYVTETENNEPCHNMATCLHPYVSYIAGIIMFFLVVYLIFVFGRCVCDDNF